MDYEVANRQITFTTAPVGQLIIYRETPTDRMVQFMEGSVLKAADMNISTLQQLHIIEEAQDWTTSNSIVFNEETLTWEGRNHRLSDLADPINAQDAVNKKYIEDTKTGYISEMNSVKDSCISSLNSIKDTFSTFVTAKTSEVNNLKTQAETAVTNANNHANRAQAWAESESSPDGEPDSKSSKTWAAEAKQSAAAAAQSAQDAADTAAGLGNPVMEVTESNGTVTVKKADNSTTTFNTIANATNATNATNAANADSATKATQDGNGNNIADTYLPKSDVANSANKVPRFNSSGHFVFPDGSEMWVG